MIGWIIGIAVALIIIAIIVIKRRNKDDEEDDIWEQVRRVKRGACGKIKRLFGC